MAKTGNPIVARLLEVMRSHRAASMDANPRGPTSCAKLREAQFSDFPAVNDLKAQMGLSPDNLENWYRLWKSNPALRFCRQPLPIGWVMEAKGRIVGYLGNIALLYHFEGTTLIATVATAFAVEPAYRPSSVALMVSFYQQKGVDLFLNTTAIPAVGEIAMALGAHKLPQPDYDTVLFWVLKPYRFGTAVMKQFGIRPALAELGGIAGAVAVTGDSLVRRRHPRVSARNHAISEIALQKAGDEFDDLWRRKVSEPGRLLTDRRPETLRWHFAIPGSVRLNHILCCRANGRLLGYVVLRTQNDTRSGLQTSNVADLLVEGDDPEVTGELLLAAFEKAKELRSHVFEVLGFPDFVRRICSAWRPYSRTFPECPFYYRTRDRTLHEKLNRADPWYAGPYDGDTTLAL